jgi:outer membrane receptor for ferrienterochelin and colicins
MGGVINIITKRPPDRATFSASVTNRFLLPHNNPDTDASPQASFDPVREQNLNAVVGFPIGRSRNSIDAEFSRGAFHYNEGVTASILPRYMRGRIGFDSIMPLTDRAELSFGGSFLLLRSDEQTSAFGNLNRRDYMRADGHVEVEWFLTDDAMLNFRLYNNYYQRDFDNYDAFSGQWVRGNRFENDNITALEVMGSWLFRPNLIFTSGIEGSFAFMDKHNLAHDFVTMNRQALFFQAERFVSGSYAAVAGVRVERNSYFGFAALPRVSGMMHLGRGFRAFVGAGMGFRAPDFTDMYMLMDAPGHPLVLGNPDLQPEYSLGYNVGLEWTGERGFFHANIFHQELWNEMSYVSAFGRPDYIPGRDHNVRMNIHRSARFGIDTEGRINLPLYTFVSVGYGWLFHWNRYEGTRHFVQPTHTLRTRLGFSLPTPRIDAHLQARWFSSFTTGTVNTTNRINQDSRFILDFFFAYQINDHFRINFGIDNITGELHPHGPATRQTFSVGIGFAY